MIGKLDPHSTGFRCLVCFESHIEHKKWYEDSKRAPYLAKSNEAHENCNMDQGLHKLAVVHSTHTRNQAQRCRQPRTGRVCHHSHRCSCRNRRWSLHPGCKTRLAVDGSHYIAFAGVTERLSAGAAISRCGPFGMYGAVHYEAPSLLVFRPA